MKVFALVGKSGTGKSYQAGNVCRDRSIESIIDDGLYIYKTSSIFGTSAKMSPTIIGAIKTALFTEESHCQEVTRAIAETNPDSVLIIGTSDGMVARIAARLGLPAISETIYIDDITTEEDLQAYRQRLRDRFGPLPHATEELISTITLRRMAKDFGIEKIVLKSDRMNCHLVANQQSPFYRSDNFANLIRYAQSHPRTAHLKESSSHLSLICDNIKNITSALRVINELTQK